jgi:hypothetical protein
MPRMARVVCPGLPHHITQRGIRRFNVFLDKADHLLYREPLKRSAQLAFAPRVLEYVFVGFTRNYFSKMLFFRRMRCREVSRDVKLGSI